MKINKNNYEAFFLDYHEGKISSADKAELEKFLSQNGDLEKEFYDFENISIQPGKVVFAEKKLLKKELSDVSVINDENFDEFCVAKLEGDLSEKENLNFEKYLNNNSNKTLDYKLYLKTLLVPYKSIVYPNKGRLKRRTIHKNANSIYILISAAASIAILLFIYFGFNKPYEVRKFTKNEIQIEKPKNQLNEFKKIAQNNLKVQNEKNKVLLIKDASNKFSQADTIINKVINNAKHPEYITALSSIYISSLPQENIGHTLFKSKEILINQDYKQEIPDKNPTNSNNRVISKIGKILKRKYFDYFNNDRLDINALALSGLKSFKEWSGANVKFDKEIDTSGNRTVYAFNSKLLGFYSSHENR
jgi:hypothetical protein